MKPGKPVTEIPNIEGPRIGGESSVRSIPTALSFLKFLLRKTFPGTNSSWSQIDAEVHPRIIQGLVILTVISVLFFPFWNVWRFPSDFNSEVMQLSNAVLFLSQARASGADGLEFLDKQEQQWREYSPSATILRRYTATSPLSSWLLYWTYRIAGPGVKTQNVLQGSLQLFTVGVVFLLGWAMYGWIPGLLSALFLSASLYFNILSKFGQNPLTLLITFVATCSFLLFFLAHKNRSRAILFSAFVALGFTCFNGWMGIISPPLILLTSVCLFGSSVGLPLLSRRAKAKEREGFRFGLQTYFMAGGVVLVTFLLLCYLYSWFFKLPLSLVFQYIHYLSLVRGTEVAASGTMSARLELVPFVLHCLFIGVIPFTQGLLTHPHQSLPGAPIIEPFVAVFFLAGLVIALRKWTLGDRLCLAWVGIGLALPTGCHFFLLVPAAIHDAGAAGNRFACGPGHSSHSHATSLVPFVLHCLFIGVIPFTQGLLTHPHQSLPGAPIIEPFVAVFFLAGLVIALRKWTLGDRLCLAWVGIGLPLPTFFSWFQPRYTMLALPAIALLAARATPPTVTRLQRFVSTFWTRLPQLAWGVVLLGVTATLVSSAYSYFGKFASRDGYLLQSVGQAEVGQLVSRLARPEDALVVLGDKVLTNEKQLFFNTGGQHYPFMFWWDDLLSGTLGGRGELAWSRLGSWEQKVLKEKQKIFYVFGVGPYYYEQPGWNFYKQHDWSEFKQLHPKLDPIRTVYFKSGIPALEIYMVDRSTPRYTSLSKQGEPGRLEFTSDRHSRFDYLKIEGATRGLNWISQDQSVTLPLASTPGQTLTVTFGPRSRSELSVSFDSDRFHRDVYQLENLTRDPEKPRLVLNAERGRLVYRISAPSKIEKIRLIAMPNLHHDVQRQNRFTIAYSLDGSDYRPVWTEQSDGSGRWTRVIDQSFPPYQSNEYWIEVLREIRPDVETVFIAFELSGKPKEVELWADAAAGHPMLISASFDGSRLPTPACRKGFNVVEIRGQAPETRLTLATSGGVKVPKVFEAEQALSFIGTNVEDADASQGRARFASVKSNLETTLLVYGPGEPIAEGHYVAEFSLKVADNQNPDKIAVLDVYASRANQTLFVRELSVMATDLETPGRYQKFYVPFQSRGDESFQYRVLWTRKADLWVDQIVVMDQVVLPEPLLEKVLVNRFEAEELPAFTGRIVEDGRASRSKARYASAGRDARSLMVYGPGTTLPAGEYVAKFWLKVRKRTLEELVAVADVTATLKGQTAYTTKELAIRGTQFNKAQTYQDFSIVFQTNGRETLQYRVLWPGKVDLWVDRVDVIPK